MLPNLFEVLTFLCMFLVSGTFFYFTFTLIFFIVGKISGHENPLFFKTFHYFKFILSVGALMYVLYFLALIFDFEISNKMNEVYFIVYFLIGILYFTDLLDVVSSIIIMIFRPYKPGDFVLVGNQAYPSIIEKINFKSTCIKKENNIMMSIRNTKVLSNPIINLSNSRSNIFVHTQFVIENQENIQSLTELIKSEIETMPKIREWPKIKIDFELHHAGFSLIDTFVWCNSEDFLEVQRFMENNVRNIFKLKNINVI
jgi:small-conductance mechanosensitive channel